jgi:hypothetical protein
MAIMDAEDQLLRIFSFQLQLAGVSESWTPSAIAELFSEVGELRQSGRIPSKTPLIRTFPPLRRGEKWAQTVAAPFSNSLAKLSL